MKSNTLIMMYTADLLDGKIKVEDIPSVLRDEVVQRSAEFAGTESKADANE